MEEKLPFEKVKRKVLVKKESKTDDAYGKKPSERNVEELIRYGIVNINKPSGPTEIRQIASGFRLCSKDIKDN